MTLAALIKAHQEEFLARYAGRITPDIRRAMDSLMICRTGLAGQSHWQCQHCDTFEHYPLSCGHRSCPMCQQRDTSQWLERQQQKLLPVDYFMVTLTLPCELRPLIWRNQRPIYRAMFDVGSRLIKDFAKTSPRLGADVGMLIVLHTHTRRLDYHPHLHIVVPGGGYDKARKQWRKNKAGFLFNETALAKVWRARMLEYLNQTGFKLPKLPGEWVVDCRKVGRGLPALKYLSRYLYRGVLPDKNIIGEHNNLVTFRYWASRGKESTGRQRTRTLPVTKFLWLVLQHVLPKRFRRLRAYGFLHSGGRRILRIIQLLLQVVLPPLNTETHRPGVLCPGCQEPMLLLWVEHHRPRF